MPLIPDATDVLSALEDAAAGLKIDQSAHSDRVCWLAACVWVLSGEVVSYGRGLTIREACAEAWLGTWDLSELIDVTLKRRPPRVADGRWRFEACPPGCWERVYASATMVRARKAIAAERLPTARNIADGTRGYPPL